MLKHRETQVVSVVAVGDDGTIIPPCGRCREMLAQVNRANLDAQVLLEKNRVVPLRTLLPEYWLDVRKS
jgi:cytidine deaminase